MAQAAQKEEQLPVRAEFDKMAAQFKAALPRHIPVERFFRIVMTSVNSNPDIARIAQSLEGRRSLFEAATKAAQDGLLPDGREGAFVAYNVKGQQTIRWMPMVAGICKKARNSGEITMMDSIVVHEGDEYDSWTDENGPHFKYKRKTPHGKPMLTFAYAKTKDGLFLEELDEADMDAIRNVSRAKDGGPWGGPFANEMRRKSALRRLAKYRLPSSADVDDVVRRDDDLYDLQSAVGNFEPLAEPKAIEEVKEQKKEAKAEAKAEVKPNGKATKEQIIHWFESEATEEEIVANKNWGTEQLKGISEQDQIEVCKVWQRRKKEVFAEK